MTGTGRIALVTGASGFVGGHVVEALAGGGWTARCLVRPRSDRQRLDGVPGVEYVLGSMEDSGALTRAVDGVDVVFHLAAVTSAAWPEDYDRVNHRGATRLLEAMAPHRTARLVFCSSLAAGGPSRGDRPLTESDAPAPIGPYGVSKADAEAAVTASGVPSVIIRPPAVYGPGDHDILAAFRLAARGLAMRTGPSGQLLSILHVHDLARGLIAAGEAVPASGVYYINGATHRWEEIVLAIGAAVGRRAHVVPVPRLIFRAVARASRAWARLSGAKPLLTPERALDLVQPAWTCDDSRARAELHYAPRIGLAEGMMATAAWYRASGWL